jgi:hypothetical protein
MKVLRSSENGVEANVYAVSISELSSSILIRLRVRRRPRVAGPGELDRISFFLSKSLGIKVGAGGAGGGGGGGGSKERSYISSDIGFPAFLEAAFFLENQPPIFAGSTCLSADHSRRELPDGTRGSEDQSDKSSVTTWGGIAGIGLDMVVRLYSWKFDSF